MLYIVLSYTWFQEQITKTRIRRKANAMCHWNSPKLQKNERNAARPLEKREENVVSGHTGPTYDAFAHISRVGHRSSTSHDINSRSRDLRFLFPGPRSEKPLVSTRQPVWSALGLERQDGFRVGQPRKRISNKRFGWKQRNFTHRWKLATKVWLENERKRKVLKK